VPRLPREPADLERPEPGRLDPTLQDPRRRLRVLLDEVPLERHQHRALLVGGETVGDLEAPARSLFEHATIS
jgi:hypothetical protein